MKTGRCISRMLAAAAAAGILVSASFTGAAAARTRVTVNQQAAVSSVTIDGQTWVMGEEYGGDPGHDCKFDKSSCDLKTLWDCPAGSVQLYVCRVCGKQKVCGFSVPVPHSYEAETVEEPTETSPGVQAFTCSRCGDTYTEEIPALGTGGGNTQPGTGGSTENSPSAVLKGQLYVEGEKYGGDPDHDCSTFETEYIWDCPSGGARVWRCDVCGKTWVREILPPAEHKYVVKVLKQATASQEGLQTLTCSVCGDTREETVPKLFSDYVPPKTTESPVVRDPSAKPAVTSNYRKNGYSNYYSRPQTSGLYERRDGNLTRVELCDDGVCVEVYDPSFHLLTSRVVPSELQDFGGFFAGESYNFLIFGQDNLNEDDDREVIRVVKYSRDWQRLGQYSLMGANTVYPFDAGSLRCTECRGMLYVITCHEMYKSSDGKNHQANVMLEIRQSDMELTDGYWTVTGESGGYVSHSFNQFILVDQEGRLITLNHGDAYPRGSSLRRFGKHMAGEEEFSDRGAEDVIVCRFKGKIGENATGASLGGLEASDSSYLTVMNSVVQDEAFESHRVRNVLVTVTPKDSFTESSTRIVSLTSNAEGGDVSASTPKIVRVSDSRFLILWEELKMAAGGDYVPCSSLKYVFVDGSGDPVGPVMSGQGRLSDCQPVLSDGRAVWYVTRGTETPVFYTIDGKTGEFTRTVSCLPDQTFPDVPSDHWASAGIAEAFSRGLVNGYPDGCFHPSDTVTGGQFCMMLGRSLTSRETMANYQEYHSGPWWGAGMWSLEIKGILQNTEMHDEYVRLGGSYGSKPEEVIPRYQMALILSNTMERTGGAVPTWEEKEQARAEIGDWSSIPAELQDAVLNCYAAGVLRGTDMGIFDGSAVMTRAQACEVVSRLLDILNV